MKADRQWNELVRGRLGAQIVAIALATAFVAHASIMTTGNVTGPGTPYNGTDDPWNTGALTIGNLTPGSMSITAGSAVSTAGNATIANATIAATSSVLIDGANSKWNVNRVFVGQQGTGTVTVTNGGAVSSEDVALSNFSDFAVGTVNIGGGTGLSTWNTSAPSEFIVGGAAAGVLNIIGGGSLSDGSGVIANFSVAPGVATVGGGTGAATWTNMSTLDIAAIQGGTGTLNIVGGGTVSDTEGTIATLVGAVGTVNVGNGTGVATWNNSQGVLVGTGGGTATLNINTGGIVIAAGLDGATVTSSVNFNGGTLRITASDPAGNKINVLAGGATFDIPTRGTTFTYNKNMSGIGGVTKTGQGTMVLNGANNYNGGTIVAGGLLSVDGSVTGPVSVNSSGTLGGVGTASGTVTVGAGGTLAPGDGIGTLNVGAMSLTDSTSALNAEINLGNTLSADLLNNSGTLTLNNSTLNLSLLNIPAILALPATFLIINDANALSIPAGTFGMVNVTAGFDATVNYAFTGTDALGRVGDGNDIAVTVFVPEPPSLGLLGAIGLFVLRSKKKAGRSAN